MPSSFLWDFSFSNQQKSRALTFISSAETVASRSRAESKLRHQRWNPSRPKNNVYLVEYRVEMRCLRSLVRVPTRSTHVQLHNPIAYHMVVIITLVSLLLGENNKLGGFSIETRRDSFLFSFSLCF